MNCSAFNHPGAWALTEADSHLTAANRDLQTNLILSELPAHGHIFLLATGLVLYLNSQNPGRKFHAAQSCLSASKELN